LYKKFGLLLVTGVLLFTFVCPAFAAGEEEFWQAWQNGDYSAAGVLAKGLGATIPEYYALAAICYQNAGKYDLFSVYKNKFHQLADPVNLKGLLDNRLNTTPDDSQAILMEGITALLFPQAQLGDPGVMFGEIAPKLQDNPYLLNYLSFNDLKNHNYSPAVQKRFQQAIALKKDYPEPYLNLATLLAQTKAVEKAVAVLLDCFNNCPLVPAAAYEDLLGLISSPENTTIKPYGQTLNISVPAIKEVYRQQVKASLSRTPEHLLSLAEVLIMKGNVAAARNLLDGVDFKGSSLYQYLQLQMAHLDNDSELLTTLGNDLLKTNDLNYRRFYEAGNIFLYGKSFEPAINFYEAALTVINPDDFEYIMKINSNMGISSYMNHQYPEAIVCFEKALAVDPHEPSSLVYLGLTYRDTGNTLKAIECLSKALDYIHEAGWRKEITAILTELNQAKQ